MEPRPDWINDRGTVVLGLFRNAGPVVLGMEMTGTAIRFVELSRSASGHCLEGWGIESLLPPGTDAAVSNQAQLAAKLLSSFAGKGQRYRSVLLALADAQLFSGMVDVPAGLSDEELDAYLRIDAAQYVPYSLDEAALDFFRLESVDSALERQRILLMICRREAVDSRVESLTQAGLQVQVVEPASHALLRLVHHLGTFGQAACVAVIEIASGQLQLLLLRADTVLHTCERPLPRVITDHELTTLIVPLLQFACSAARVTEVDRILLYGRVSDTLAVAVAEACGTACQILDPFSSIRLANPVDAEAVATCASQLAVPCGLALRGLA